jgi:uncharacterized protein
MELHHRFTVPAGVEETWAHLNDIEGVAGCFPGATVSEADAESFKGSVKVKLGPIALVYNGTGTFVEKDEVARRMVIDAKGKDKRGNGTAGATVTATMADTGSGGTEVDVTTDLSITGKAAQFGRGGVIKDVSDKLLGQFVACLEQRLGSTAEAPSPAATPPPPGAAAAAPVAEPDPAAPGPGGTGPEPAPGEAVPDPDGPPPQPAADVPSRSSAPRESSAPRDEAINLGSTVLPVLVRAYWKPVVAAVVLVALIIWLVG